MLQSPLYIYDNEDHSSSLYRVPTAQGQQRKWSQKNPCRGKLMEFENFAKTKGNLVCSSCKFPDSKGKRYFEICRENSQFLFEAGYVYQVSLV